jgi:uncharacterized protein (DUF433 family)
MKHETSNEPTKDRKIKMSSLSLNEGEITAIRSVVDTHKATDAAIFSLATEKQGLKALQKTAERMLEALEIEGDNTPHINGGRAVSITFRATSEPGETLHRQADRITESHENRETNTENAGGPERVTQHCQMAQELAKEFTTTLTVNPNMKSGKPCIRGLRITAFDILELVACGRTPDEITAEEPLLMERDIQDCVQFGLRMAEAASG